MSPTIISPKAPGLVEFVVPGIPAPKGSLRAFMRKGGRFPVTIDDNAKTKPWMSVVALKAHESGCRATQLPVSVELRFYVPRPKGHFGSKGLVRQSSPTLPSRKPDIDKLSRAVLDALTGIAYQDDAQVAVLEARKVYADVYDPGAWVRIRELAP